MDYDLGFDATQHQAVLAGVTFSTPFDEKATDLYRAWARGRGVMDAIVILDLYESFTYLQTVRTADALSVFLDQLVPGICDNDTWQYLRDGIAEIDPAEYVDDLWGKAAAEIQVPLYSRWKSYWEEFNRELQAYQAYWLNALQQDPGARPGAPWGQGTGQDRYPEQYGTLPPVEETEPWGYGTGRDRYPEQYGELPPLEAPDWSVVYERNMSVLAAICARKAATTETSFAYADQALLLGDGHEPGAIAYVTTHKPATGVLRFKYKRVGPCELVVEFSDIGLQQVDEVQNNVRSAANELSNRGSWPYMSKPKIL